jgi:hypothetical protein
LRLLKEQCVAELVFTSAETSQPVGSAHEEEQMELSLRLDTLGLLEMRHLRGRDRYRDWPQFQLLAASRQASVMAYMSRDVAEELHQQIVLMETAVGLDVDAEDDEEDGADEVAHSENPKSAERESGTGTLSPAFAQALERLNDLARQRLPEGSASSSTGELAAANPLEESEDEDTLEQLQDAFIQMMEVVRELAEEMATDALKITTRFRCARTNIEFIQDVTEDDEDDEDEDDDQDKGRATLRIRDNENILEVEIEFVLVLQLFEEGRAKVDDLPAIELRLDVEDFERLHETLDYALNQDKRSRRRR